MHDPRARPRQRFEHGPLRTGKGSSPWPWRRSKSGSGSVGTSPKPGTHPYDSVEWERREARIPNWKDGTDAFLQPDVEFPVSWSQNATNIVAQKYFRGHARHRRARVVAAPGRSTASPTRSPSGACATATSSTTQEAAAFRDELKYVLVHPARRVQLAGLVQHRREGRPAAGERVLHPRGRRHDGRHPQLVPRGGHDLQGRLRLGHQPLATSARRTRA